LSQGKVVPSKKKKFLEKGGFFFFFGENFRVFKIMFPKERKRPDIRQKLLQNQDICKDKKIFILFSFRERDLPSLER